MNKLKITHTSPSISIIQMAGLISLLLVKAILSMLVVLCFIGIAYTGNIHRLAIFGVGLFYVWNLGLLKVH